MTPPKGRTGPSSVHSPATGESRLRRRSKSPAGPPPPRSPHTPANIAPPQEIDRRLRRRSKTPPPEGASRSPHAPANTAPPQEVDRRLRRLSKTPPPERASAGGTSASGRRSAVLDAVVADAVAEVQGALRPESGKSKRDNPGRCTSWQAPAASATAAKEPALSLTPSVGLQHSKCEA